MTGESGDDFGGMPQVDPAAIAAERQSLRVLQARLRAIDPSDWPVPEQVDYHLVRAELNGLDFRHRVTRPWFRDPGTYSDVVLFLGERAGMLNVYLFPYSWDELRTLVELEDNRVIGFQRLEENRNRHLPELKPVQSQAEYKQSVADAIDDLMTFVTEQRIWSMPDYLTPDATTLRGVGHHMLMVVGKIQFMKLIRDRAQQQGDDFELQVFMDEFFESGLLPIALIRWEMTGYADEVSRLW